VPQPPSAPEVAAPYTARNRAHVTNRIPLERVVARSEPTHTRENRPAHFGRRVAVMFRNRAQEPMDRADSQFANPKVPKARDDVPIRRIPISKRCRR
jgi:hypothetical protein